jgi:hypothetical protein
VDSELGLPCALGAARFHSVDRRFAVAYLPRADLYQGAVNLTHARDSQGDDFLIQGRKLKEVCDGVGDWVAGRL